MRKEKFKKVNKMIYIYINAVIFNLFLTKMHICKALYKSGMNNDGCM